MAYVARKSMDFPSKRVRVGWQGGGVGEAQEGGDMRMPMVDPCGCMAETSTIL